MPGGTLGDGEAFTGRRQNRTLTSPRRSFEDCAGAWVVPPLYAGRGPDGSACSAQSRPFRDVAAWVRIAEGEDERRWERLRVSPGATEPRVSLHGP